MWIKEWPIFSTRDIEEEEEDEEQDRVGKQIMISVTGSNPIELYVAHLGILGNDPCTFKKWTSAMTSCKEEFTLSLENQ